MGRHLGGGLGPAGRVELVGLIVEDGVSERAAAAARSVAPATARRWQCRWWSAGEEDRVCGRWALGRSSRPRRSPARTAADLELRVCQERRRTGWGPRLIAGTTGVAHSTVHAILVCHGPSRAPTQRRGEVCRYEWPCPGDLVHVDVKQYPRFRRPGHAVTGDRRAQKLHPRQAAGPRPLPRHGRRPQPAGRSANGPSASATSTAAPATAHRHTGSPTTTSADPTQPSTANPPINRAHNLPRQDH